LALAGRTSTKDVNRVVARVLTTERVPELGASLSEGVVSAGHVDVVGDVLRSCEPALRDLLVSEGAWIARRAAVLTPQQLRRELGAEVRELEADGGMAKLERQRRACRLRSWVDRDGMWCFHGQFDPETGLKLHQRLVTTTEQLFAQAVPADAPDYPIERQGFLRARALVAMVSGRGAAVGGPELIAVVDATGLGGTDVDATGATTTDVDGHGHVHGRGNGQATIDWGLPVELPLRVLHDLFGVASIHAVVVRNGVVLHAPGTLDLGRTTRLANRAQRRVLRALYPTCAILGCEARFELCKVHHVVWWEHGGATDLDNLLPLCSRHHHDVHDGGWQLKLAPDRQLTVTYPNGTTQTTGPPQRR
jgi:hypothetical protein